MELSKGGNRSRGKMSRVIVQADRLVMPFRHIQGREKVQWIVDEGVEERIIVV